ncbi:MAG: citramalate synthase, partial [Actinobacteria bacterium]|nr:citramalate synthase [Actinomycetota bacterium]
MGRALLPDEFLGRYDMISIYDTTLRDGSQMEGIAFTVEDKLRIAARLDAFGVAYIEGGFPGSNPKDIEFFERVGELGLKHAKIAAFGSVRHKDKAADEDPGLRSLVESGCEVLTIFGKSWDAHVTRALRATLDENLRMVEDSIAYLK